ncbi:hypothetical protein, partial [Insolitispirillum peregrinum]|uniref:hypothetical protein n=1 Tax=Insolitispirillum peregrinum TaxID=80876 RepID=UPI001C37BA1B
LGLRMCATTAQLIEQPPTHPFRLFTMSNSEPLPASPEGPEFLDRLPLSKLPVSGRSVSTAASAACQPFFFHQSFFFLQHRQ